MNRIDFFNKAFHTITFSIKVFCKYPTSKALDAKVCQISHIFGHISVTVANI